MGEPGVVSTVGAKNLRLDVPRVAAVSFLTKRASSVAGGANDRTLIERRQFQLRAGLAGARTSTHSHR